jgi:hypothetical protein
MLMKKKGKKEGKLAKRVLIGGLVVKGLILPIKADCPSIKHKYSDNIQQNLKKIEYTISYEKRNNLPTYSGFGDF